MPFEKRALLIAGPTASGKSALALRRAQAERDGGVIINADALQVYRELRILTARPSEDDEVLAPHRLYGQVSGSEAYSVGRWLADAGVAMEEAWSQGRLPIIVGGTGLYFRALEHGLAEVPPIPQEVRAHWRGYTGDLHRELAKRDAASAAKLAPQDRQRLARALEVIDGTAKSLAEWQAAGAPGPLQGIASERLWLDVDRAAVYRRAEQRFDAMLGNGALREAAGVAHFDPKLPVMRALGLRELLEHLAGNLSEADAIAAAKTATRNYIKRQLTWRRGQMQGWTAVPYEHVASGPPMDASPVTSPSD
jgi:tRNA dimethylallyltransferase